MTKEKSKSAQALLVLLIAGVGVVLSLAWITYTRKTVRPKVTPTCSHDAGQSEPLSCKESKMETKSDKNDDHRQQLTRRQYMVLHEKATEPPFSGKYWNFKGKGIYRCAGCGSKLFHSDTKFDSGSGWPSFTKPLTEKNVDQTSDNSHGMQRTEVLCAKCGGHLGHVFDDGPEPSGLRYCINSAALRFQPAEENLRKATFAAGCFWHVEECFRKLPGVLSTTVGYTGGHLENPTYRQVCTDTTGHAEAVRITYDPQKISYHQLLDTFWKIHDPTTPNRQGPDQGSQYRSAIFFHSDKQRIAAKQSMQEHQNSAEKPIVTEITPAGPFYRAEKYHQQYLQKQRSR